MIDTILAPFFVGPKNQVGISDNCGMASSSTIKLFDQLLTIVNTGVRCEDEEIILAYQRKALLERFQGRTQHRMAEGNIMSAAQRGAVYASVPDQSKHALSDIKVYGGVIAIKNADNSAYGFEVSIMGRGR